MVSRWRLRVLMAVFLWLWRQLRHEGTREWLLDLWLKSLSTLLEQMPEDVSRIIVEVFEESDRLHRLSYCERILSFIEPLRRKPLAALLARYFRAKLNYRRGYLGRAETGYYRLLLDPSVIIQLRARALEGLARIHYDQGRLLLAEHLLRRSNRLFRLLGNRLGIASTYVALALLHRRRNAWRQAYHFSRQSLGLLTRHYDSLSIQLAGEVLLGIGVMERLKGRFEVDEAIIRRLLLQFIGSDNTYGHALAVYHYSRLCLYQREYDEGFRLATKALELFQSVQAIPETGRTYRTLGELYSATDAHGEAQEVLLKSLTIFRRRNDLYSVALALGCMGVHRRRKGQTGRAVQMLRRSLLLKREVGDGIGVGWTLLELAKCLKNLGNLPEALSAGEKAWAIARKYHHRPRELEASLFLKELGRA